MVPTLIIQHMYRKKASDNFFLSVFVYYFFILIYLPVVVPCP